MTKKIDVKVLKDQILAQFHAGNKTVMLPAGALCILLRFLNKLPIYLRDSILSLCNVSKENYDDCIVMAKIVNLAKLQYQKEKKEKLINNIKKDLSGKETPEKAKPSAPAPNKQKMRLHGSSKPDNRVLIDCKGDYVFTGVLSNGKMLTVNKSVVDTLRPHGKDSFYYTYLINDGSDRFAECIQRMEVN